MSQRRVPELGLLSYVRGSENERAKFVDQLFAGIKDYGFVILTNHIAALEQVERAYQLSRELFALPPEVKERYSAKGNGGQRGHTAFGTEHARDYLYPDLKEFWHVGRDIPRSHPYASYYPANLWPQEIPEFHQVVSELYQTLDEVSCILLDALGRALDVAPNYFADMVELGNSILRIIHYPPVPPDAHPMSVRAAAHGDINLITLLVGATNDGLQLLDRDGQWLDVQTRPGQIVVDSGDMLSRITNEVIPSTIHRVINPDNSRECRYSMPFFVHPHPLAVLDCISSCEGSGVKYPPISSHDFLMERLQEIGLK